MEAIKAPEIDESYISFAKIIAHIAETHGIDRFEMTFRPCFEKRMKKYDPRVIGDMKINFSDTDGRGRPCRNLSINISANMSLNIEENPESFS